MINGDSADPEISLDCRRVVARAVSQKNPRPFGFPHWRNARSLQSFKSIFFLWSEGQRWKFGFSGHAPKDNRPEASVNVLVKRYTSRASRPKLPGEHTRPACGFPRPRGKPRTHEKGPGDFQASARKAAAREARPATPEAGVIPNFGVRVHRSLSASFSISPAPVVSLSLQQCSRQTNGFPSGHRALPPTMRGPHLAGFHPGWPGGRNLHQHQSAAWHRSALAVGWCRIFRPAIRRRIQLAPTRGCCSRNARSTPQKMRPSSTPPGKSSRPPASRTVPTSRWTTIPASKPSRSTGFRLGAARNIWSGSTLSHQGRPAGARDG